MIRHRPGSAVCTVLKLVIYFGIQWACDAAAWALPEYTQKEEKPCAYCHLAPNGAGPRNYRGEFYRKNFRRFTGFDDALEAARAGEPLGPSATPPPKSITPPIKKSDEPRSVRTAPSAMPSISAAAAKTKSAKTSFEQKRSIAARKAYADALLQLGRPILKYGDPLERRDVALGFFRRAFLLDPTNADIQAVMKDAGSAPADESPPQVRPKQDGVSAAVEVPADGAAVLRKLAARWRSADTFEYRSRAVMEHVGEPRITLQTHARFQRPGKARIVFDGNIAEASRTRVSDGVFLYDRMAAAPLRPGQTLRAPYRGRFTEDISHPLDMGSYSADQFFSPTPFLPPPSWGDPLEPRRFSAVRTKLFLPEEETARSVYRITITQGAFRDVLILDAVNFSPLRLTRFGLHAGSPQELLTETFSDVRLGAPLDASLFRWRKDETGAN